MKNMGLFKTGDDKGLLSVSISSDSTSSCHVDEDWLSLSITVGSRSSCYEVDEEQISKNTWTPQQESSGNINNVNQQEHESKRLSALKKWEMARGSTEENFISLSIQGSSTCSYDEEKMELKKGNHARESSCGSSNSMGSQEQEKLRLSLSTLRKSEMLIEKERGSNREKWLSLSIPGSSTYDGDEEEKSKEKRRRRGGIGPCIIASEEEKQRPSNIKKLKPSLEIAARLRKNRKLIITDSSLSSQVEDKKVKENNCHSSSSSTTEKHLHCKKRKATQEIADESIANTKLRITESSSREKEQEEEEDRQRELYLNKGKQKIGDMFDNGSLCNKTSSTEASERGWLEVAFDMGVPRPELYLSKRVTQSDAKPEQHRFQLTQSDIGKAMQPLQQLAEQARLNAVPVKVLDKKGNEHDLVLKYLPSSHTYRFMGTGYTNFLSSSKLKESEIMSIWGLPGGGRAIEGEIWLAFVNSDEILKA